MMMTDRFLYEPVLMDDKQIRRSNGDATYEVTRLGKKILTTGTVLQIVETFVSQTQDVEQIHYLILAHEQFIPSLAFLKEFISCFKSSDDQLKQFRIVNVLKKWIELSTNFRDPNSDLGREIRLFKEYLIDHQSQLVSFLQGAIDPQKEEVQDEDHDETLTSIPIPPPVIYLRRLANKKKE